MELASRMARIDGALHLTANGNLLAFGCLLDGQQCANEIRSRGARYNSAVRFTRTNPTAVVLILSSDGPLSCFFNGEDISNKRDYSVGETRLVPVDTLD